MLQPVRARNSNLVLGSVDDDAATNGRAMQTDLRSEKKNSSRRTMGTRQVRHQSPATMTKASELSRHPGESIRGRRQCGWTDGRRAARDRRAPPILRRRRSAREAKTAALATNPGGE